MRAILFAAFFLAASAACAGTWTRVDRNTLGFKGDIDLGEYERFSAVYDGNVTELIVDSPGGITDEGIKIGLALAQNDVKVTVTGECLSSCANYLFTAGHRREIKHGIVGYHGNVKACFAAPDKRAKLIEDMKRRYHMSDEDIKRNLAEQDKEVEAEARLLQTMGVQQGLFDRTCTDDKGMGDGKSYGFLLPKPATFERYGLYGIVGDQDPAIIAALPYPVAVD